MFDVGFTELILIAVVALLVVGPQRLPAVARTAGLWFGRGKRLLTSVKADIEQELRTEELKRVLKEQADSNPLHEILEDTKSDLASIGEQAETALKEPGDKTRKPDSDSSP
ncbi:MAG: Sec-independent protein translocase protein TatB [Pseudomonadota bacterium]